MGKTTAISIVLLTVFTVRATDALIGSETKSKASAGEATRNSRRETFGQIARGALLPVAFPSAVNAADNYPYKVSTLV